MIPPPPAPLSEQELAVIEQRMADAGWYWSDAAAADDIAHLLATVRALQQQVGTMNDLLTAMHRYLDTLSITGDNIGEIRRSLFMPFDCAWNGVVRDETAKRETPGESIRAARQEPPHAD